MENIYNFLVENPIVAIIFAVVVVVIVIYLLIKAIQKVGLEKVRGTVYGLFLEAEHLFNSGEGKEKFEWVIKFAREAIPAPFNLFITEKLLRKVVQLWFDLTKDLLDDGKLNNSEESHDESSEGESEN